MASPEQPKASSKRRVSFAPDSKDGVLPKENGEQVWDGEDQIHDVFELSIQLPHFPHKTELPVSLQEQVQDMRQSIIDLPFTMQYTCFHLEHNGRRVNDFIELSEVPGIGPGAEFKLVEDPYTEKDARLHFVRIRELMGASGDRTDPTQGILAGMTLHDDLTWDGQSPSAMAAGYDFEKPVPYETILPKPQPAPIKTIKNISVSPWNPPPCPFRMKGHLLYLQVTTNEGDQFQITSHTCGFFVNRSTKDKFDPSPKTGPKDMAAHSLLTLISQLSPSFDKAFDDHIHSNNRKDPLALFALQNAIPASPWLVPSPTSATLAHSADLTRSQESYLYSGAENADSLRDWNEEFQSTRELPKEQMQERVFRERLTSKLFADFSDAAAKGAVLVARGDVLALNPTEARDAQIFVYNNIFYSFGADGMGTFAADGGDEAARMATGKDVVGVKAMNQLDVKGLFTPGTVIVDYLGKRIVAQSIVPGIFKQREPGEHQVDYGGVEGKDVVAYNEAFAPLFKQMSEQMHVKSHAVWDKEEKRFDLDGSVETKGLLGTDGRKYVLDLYRITPVDVTWLEKHWSAPEGEGVVKEEGKDYPHRMAVLRPELVSAYSRVNFAEFLQARIAKQGEKAVETNGTSEHKDEEDAEHKDEEGAEHEGEKGAEHEGENGAEPKTSTEIVVNGTSTTMEEVKQPELPHIDASDFKFSLNPDVFCGQVPQTAEEKEELEKDEADVRAVCVYLAEKVIPGLVQELQEGDVGFPMDGRSLSQLLHKRGINIRYLGEIASLAKGENPRLQALRSLARQEMVSRAFKHIANVKMAHLPAPAAASCVAHLLNCLLGGKLNKKPVPETDELVKSFYPNDDFSFESMTPARILHEIVHQVKLRYRHDLQEEDVVQEGKQMQLLREVSLKLGLQLEAKDYIFAPASAETKSNGVNGVNGVKGVDGVNGVDRVNGVNGHDTAHAEPHTNGAAKKSKGKKKKASDQGPPHYGAATPSQNVTFHADDILNIVPVVKEASPKSVLAEDAFEAGRISIHQGDRQRGQTLLLESLSLYEQIYGILHAEVASAYAQLSTVYFGLDEKPAAVELARKAVIVSERTSGIDSTATILNYLSLGLFEHSAGNGELGLRYILHALDLLKVVYGPNHPDSITTINNGAVMLQQLKMYPESRRWFEASLATSDRVAGSTSVATATLLFQLSQALALDGDGRGAVNKMRDAYNIFKERLGAENINTQDAATWMGKLTENAVLQAKREKVMNGLPDVGEDGKVWAARALAGRATLGEMGAVGGVGANGIGTGAKRALDKSDIAELIRYIEGGEGRTSSQKKKPMGQRRLGRVG